MTKNLLNIRDFDHIITEAIQMAKINNYHISKIIIPLYIQKILFDKIVNFDKNKIAKEFSPMVNFMGISAELGLELEIIIKIW